MQDYQRFTHTKWGCKYHVVFIPKKSKTAIFVSIRKCRGVVQHELVGQRESKPLVGSRTIDHVPLCISIPLKYFVANVVGYCCLQTAR